MTRRRPTHRQLQVLRERCRTGSRKGAATALGLSERTIRDHIERMLLRCGCIDEAQACFEHARELARLPAL